MIGRHHIGALGALLLGLGAIALPPPRHADEATTKAIADLRAAGLDPDVVAMTGPRDFVATAQALLGLQTQTLAMTGQFWSTHDLLDVLQQLTRSPIDPGFIDDVVSLPESPERKAKIAAWYEQMRRDRGQSTRTTLADLRAAGATIGQDFAVRPDTAVIVTSAHGKASILEATGRRGPGGQLRDERERVWEPLRILAAYTHLTAVELGEIERGVRIPTAEEWAALQVALPDLGPMEAPPTAAERRPTIPQPNLHPAGRCTCAQTSTCEWCEMDRRRELREARKSKRAALQASLGSQALRGVEVDYRTPKQERRAAKSRKRARKGWA